MIPTPQTPEQYYQAIHRLQISMRMQKRCVSCFVLRPVEDYAGYGARVCRWCASTREAGR